MTWSQHSHYMVLKIQNSMDMSLRMVLDSLEVELCQSSLQHSTIIALVLSQNVTLCEHVH